jgi:hypothetical protein
MVLKVLRVALLPTVVLAAWALVSQPAQAQYVVGGPGDLFYNYYAPPVDGGVGAAMYPCPRPTPPLVGHTYITYQPLYPQEFLYKHHRTYKTYHSDTGPTTTHVSWGGSYLGQGLKNLLIGPSSEWRPGHTANMLDKGPN